MQIVQPPDGQADQERARMARGRPAGRPVTTSRLAPRADTPLPFVRAPAGTVDLDAGIVDCIGALRDLPRRALPTELHDVRTADLRRAAVVRLAVLQSSAVPLQPRIRPGAVCGGTHPGGCRPQHGA